MYWHFCHPCTGCFAPTQLNKFQQNKTRASLSYCTVLEIWFLNFSVADKEYTIYYIVNSDFIKRVGICTVSCQITGTIPSSNVCYIFNGSVVKLFYSNWEIVFELSLLKYDRNNNITRAVYGRDWNLYCNLYR